MSEQNIKPEIMDKLTKVCLCRGISRATIKDAIMKGASTVEDIKLVTKATTGSCSGRRCTAKIQALIDEFYKK